MSLFLPTRLALATGMGRGWDPAGNIRTEGDSLMDGAYGFAVWTALANLLPTKLHTDTAVGGSTMDDQRSRMLDPANAALRKRTTIWWDGSQNGITTVAAYVDLMAQGLAVLHHDKFVVIPPINPYGSTYAGGQAEAIAAEMLARWPNNFLHWNTFLKHASNAIDGGEFYNPGTDNYHLSETGTAHAAIGIYNFLMAKGWIAAQDDPIIAAGSAWLFDPSLAGGAFSGVPAHASVKPNVAWPQAAAMVGSGDATTLGTHISVYNNADDVLIERTPKLGLHVILSQDDNYIVQSQGVLVQPHTLIQQFLEDRVSDDWYFSLWYRPTRAPLAVGPNGTNVAKQSLFHKARDTSNYLFHNQDADETLFPGSGGNWLGALSLPAGSGNYGLNLNTPILRSIGTTGYSGTNPGLSNNAGLGLGLGDSQRGLGVALGAMDAWAYFNRGIAPSGILYRAYAENLSVSGRTFATVSAIERVLFNAAFAGGGAFAGDTYTDPATFP